MEINRHNIYYRFLRISAAILFSTVFSIAYSDEVTNHLDIFLKGLDSYQATFNQTLLDEHGEKLETSSGIVYLQQPGKFRWDYQEPYSQMIMTDGQTLWIYDEDLEQVTIRDISDSIENTPAAILDGNKNLDENFVIIDMGNTDGYDIIELTPRDIEGQYSNIRLGFDKNELVMMVLFDNLGQITRIDFLDAQRNNKLDAKLFTFEPPFNVDVIDDRG
jgi:outer membrane lipoprotein carrier protein